MAGTKYRRYGKEVEELFFSAPNMTLVEVQKYMKQKGIKIHLETLKRWNAKYHWDEQRKKTEISFDNMIVQINGLLGNSNFNSQTAYAVSNLLDKAIQLDATLKERYSKVKIEISDDDNHIIRLEKLRDYYSKKLADEKTGNNIKSYLEILKTINLLLREQKSYEEKIFNSAIEEVLRYIEEYARKKNLDLLKEFTENIEELADFIIEKME